MGRNTKRMDSTLKCDPGIRNYTYKTRMKGSANLVGTLSLVYNHVKLASTASLSAMVGFTSLKNMDAPGWARSSTLRFNVGMGQGFSTGFVATLMRGGGMRRT